MTPLGCNDFQVDDQNRTSFQPSPSGTAHPPLPLPLAPFPFFCLIARRRVRWYTESMANQDLELIRHALKVARANGVAEVEIEVGKMAFAATLSPQPLSLRAVTAAAEDETSENGRVQSIVSPLVGYLKPAKEPLRVGQQVAKGSVVAVVSALGLANDVESAFDGVVVEVLVEPDAPVEYGQPIATVKVSQ